MAGISGFLPRESKRLWGRQLQEATQSGGRLSLPESRQLDDLPNPHVEFPERRSS